MLVILYHFPIGKYLFCFVVYILLRKYPCLGIFGNIIWKLSSCRISEEINRILCLSCMLLEGTGVPTCLLKTESTNYVSIFYATRSGNICMNTFMLGRTAKARVIAHTRKEGHSSAVHSTESTLLIESRFLYTSW